MASAGKTGEKNNSKTVSVSFDVARFPVGQYCAVFSDYGTTAGTPETGSGCLNAPTCPCPWGPTRSPRRSATRRTSSARSYNSPFSTRWFVITFGTDSSLTTGPGWDDVSGLGTADGASFVAAIAP